AVDYSRNRGSDRTPAHLWPGRSARGAVRGPGTAYGRSLPHSRRGPRGPLRLGRRAARGGGPPAARGLATPSASPGDVPWAPHAPPRTAGEPRRTGPARGRLAVRPRPYRTSSPGPPSAPGGRRRRRRRSPRASRARLPAVVRRLGAAGITAAARPRPPPAARHRRRVDGIDGFFALRRHAFARGAGISPLSFLAVRRPKYRPECVPNVGSRAAGAAPPRAT